MFCFDRLKKLSSLTLPRRRRLCTAVCCSAALMLGINPAPLCGFASLPFISSARAADVSTAVQHQQNLAKGLSTSENSAETASSAGAASSESSSSGSAARSASASDGLTISSDLLQLSQSFGSSADSKAAASLAAAADAAAAQPFQAELLQRGDLIEVQLQMAPGAYVYQESLKASGTNLSLETEAVKLPPAVSHQDIQGDHQVYFDSLTLHYPVKNCSNAAPAEFTFTYQGCDSAGICYPPAKVKLAVDTALLSQDLSAKLQQSSLLEQASAPAANSEYGTAADAAPAAKSSTAAHAITAIKSPDTPAADASSDTRPQAPAQPQTQDGQILTVLSSNFALGLLLCFGLGILLDLTPCVLPMLPIISAMTAGSVNATRMQVIKQNIGYSAGLCTVYTLLGLLFASVGASLQGILQHPAFLITIALLLVICALACIDVLQLPLPQKFNNALQNFAGKRQQGRFSSAFILGGVSALIASPCTSAPLAGALLYVMQTGSLVKGAAAFCAIGLGMAAPLFIIGLFGSELIKKAGRFAQSIKKILAVLLTAAALYLVRTLLDDTLFALLMGLVIALGVFYIGFNNARGHLRSGQFLPMVLLTLVSLALWQNVYSLCAPTELSSTSSGTAAGTKTVSASIFTRIDSLSELKQYVQSAGSSENSTGAGAKSEGSEEGRRILLDFTAAWCTNCKAMEKGVFASEEFAALAQERGLTLLQFDITDVDDPKVQEMISHFKLFGVPYLVVIEDGVPVRTAAGLQSLEEIKGLTAP